MKQLKFQTRIVIGFLVIILISLTTSIFTIKNTLNIVENTHLVLKHPFTVSNATRDIKINITSIHGAIKDICFAQDSMQIQQALSEIEVYDSLTHKAFTIVKERFLGDKRIVEETYNLYIDWKNIRNDVVLKTQQGKFNEAIVITKGKGAERVTHLLDKTQYLINFAETKAQEFEKNILEEEDKSIITTIILTTILLLISIISSIVISKSIAKPVQSFITKLNDIYKHDKKNAIINRSEQQLLSDTIKDIHIAYSRLENFNAELDKKVDARTIELQESESRLSKKVEEYLSLNEEYNEKNNEYLALNEEYKTQNEHLIVAKEKAEESDRLKSAFLSNMSHEIRTPMNAILGFSSLLNSENLTHEKRTEYVALIQNGGKRLLRLISDIVDISKIDAKQLSLHYTACNLNELITNLEKQFSLTNKTQQVHLTSKKGLQDIDSVIHTDETRLTQIISNLIENAQKYTDSGSIEFGYVHKEKELEFYIKDSGIGISKENQEKIFERFMQVETEYSKTISGTGLGLAIVRGIVELFNGDIWVESNENIGTTFFFTIPYITDTKTLKENIAFTKIEPTQKTKVLIAEDEESNFLLLRELLSSEKFEITRAYNGAQAIEIFKNSINFDIIFMDIKMPIINGIEATRAIRKIDSKIPIIAQTAYAMAEEKTKILRAGCSSYLTKPISEDALFKAINKHL